jgi:putative nucleotidyltransferase-like protein
VMPLLYHHLCTMCPDALPTAAFTQLQAQFHANAGHNLFLTGELLRVLQLLEAHGLPALPFKGPTLAVSVYSNLALRQFSDVDLLVHERDYRSAQRLLMTHGYQLTKDFDFESSLVQDTRRVAVDLHRGIVPHQFHCSLDFERLWTYRQPVSLIGTTISTLAPEDLLMVLCMQVSRDTWGALFKPCERRYDSLLKFCDIAELLQVSPGMDWDRVLADTRRFGAQRMLLFGLRVASELLGTTLPQVLRSRVQAHPTISGLTAHTRAQLFDEADASATTSLTPERFHFAIRERWQDKVFPYLYAGALLIVPSEKDRMFLPLPGYLTILYYVIRPFRALRDYGWRLFFQQLKRWLVWGAE